MRIRIVIVLGLIVLAACQKERVSASAPARPAPSAAAATASQPAEADRVKIKTPNGETFADVRVTGNDVKIEFTDGGSARVMRGKIRDSGKRKYERDDGGAVAEVKPGDQGFKVRTPDGKLLWKIKISDDKIKISDNEENQNPYELKTKYDDKVKVVDASDRELGNVKFYRDKQRVEVKNPADAELYKMNTDRYSAMSGVLLMDRIPLEQKVIIMAELLARGK